MHATEASNAKKNLLGLLFGEDFGQENEFAPAVEVPSANAAPEPEPEPEIPAITAADLDAAREEGRRLGRLEAENGLAGARNRIVQQIAGSLTDAQEIADRLAEESVEQVSRIVLSTMTTLLPVMCERYGNDEIRAIVKSLLPVFSFQQRVTIRVHPAMLAAVRSEIDIMDPDLAERAHVVPTDTVKKGDLRVSWSEGSLVRDTGEVRRALDRAFISLGLSTEAVILEKELADA